MNNFKEFHAKNLDQAIADACNFFGTERIKLEINILEDAKTGVFGLIGARKARVQARLAEFPSVSLSSEKEEAKQKRTHAKNQAKTAKPKGKSKLDKIEEQIEQVEKTKSIEVVAVEEQAASHDKKSAREDKKPRTPRNFEKKSFQHYDEEEGESQSQFLSNMHDDDEMLDEQVLEELDREAMAKANMLGNMTEAEIRANSDYNERSNFKTHRKGMRKNEKEKPFRDKYLAKREKTERHEKGERQEKTERHDRTERHEKTERQEKKTFKPNVQLSSEEIKQLDAEERRQYYIQKRQNERENRPPKQFVAIEYEASPLPRVPLEELDQEKLIQVSVDTIKNLVGPIVGEEAPVKAVIADDRVQISIESEDTGLLIGKEGQNLAAIQYIATRIITRQMESQIRIQVDTGDYYSRQDARLEFLAKTLAERVKLGGRPQSTRPLSAYQRRLIHLALQDDTEVITRSCGEGSLKRVVVMRKRFTGNDQENQKDLPEGVEFENYTEGYEEAELLEENFEGMEVNSDITAETPNEINLETNIKQ